MKPWVVISQFAMGLAVLGYLLWPFVKGRYGTIDFGEDDGAGTGSNVESFVQVMSDLEYDYETGKLSREDYERLRQEVYAESDVDPGDFESSPEESTGDDEIEEAVRRARQNLEQ